VVSDETRVLVLSKKACHFPSVSEFRLSDLLQTFEPNSVSKLASYISFNQSSSPTHASLRTWIGKNLLLSGPAGSGKTSLVQSLCDNLQSRFVRITLSGLISFKLQYLYPTFILYLYFQFRYCFHVHINWL
jgi:AAA+ superfamily predicted ATPase